MRGLGRYLKVTLDKGTLLIPKTGKYPEVYMDADFILNWDKYESLDRDTARSRHGYITMYNVFTLLWKYKFQTDITLSSTESEYTVLAYALRGLIPKMQLMKEPNRA